MVNSDLERYRREQMRMLDDLDWKTSEDSLIDAFVTKSREFQLSPADAGDLARQMLGEHGLDADITERFARRVIAGISESLS